jgi:hypothetical protein
MSLGDLVSKLCLTTTPSTQDGHRYKKYKFLLIALFQVKMSSVANIMLYRVHLPCMGFELTTLVVIDTDCIGSSKSNYHAIKTKTVPN